MEKIEGRTKNRIKRGSFTHEVKKLQKDYPAVLTIPTLPLSKQSSPTPVKTLLLKSRSKLDQGKELDTSIKRSLALVNIAENYPPETWTHVQQPRQLQTAALLSSSSIPVVQHRLLVLQNYRAEKEALKQATILVKNSLEPCSPTVFLTDALSVLEG